MSDRVKYVKVIFDDIGRIARIYKSVHFAGEGAPRDVEIDAGEMLQIFGSSNAVGVAAISEMETDLRKAEACRLQAEDALQRKIETIAVLEETNNRLDAALSETSAAKASIEEEAARKAAIIAEMEARVLKLESETATKSEPQPGDQP